MDETISMDSPHHEQFNDIVSVLGRVADDDIIFLLVEDKNHS